MEVYTIGFTKKTAPEFFGALRRAGVRRLLDVRLNNTSQLARFARREDLPFFLQELCGAEYVHEPLLAPTKEMLEPYRKGEESWPEYESRFLALMRERRVAVPLGLRGLDVPLHAGLEGAEGIFRGPDLLQLLPAQDGGLATIRCGAPAPAKDPLYELHVPAPPPADCRQPPG